MRLGTKYLNIVYHHFKDRIMRWWSVLEGALMRNVTQTLYWNEGVWAYMHLSHVRSQDLWKDLVEILRRRGPVPITRGHSGMGFTERCVHAEPDVRPQDPGLRENKVCYTIKYYYVRAIYVHVREGRFQYNNVLHSHKRKWEPASNREHLCTHVSVSTIDVDLRTYARVESLRRDTCNREHRARGVILKPSQSTSSTP